MAAHGATEHPAADLADRPQYDDVNSSLVLMVGLVSAIITFLIIGFVQGLAYRWESTFTQDNLLMVNREVRQKIENQKAVLQRVLDDQGAPLPGRLTIEEAMAKTLQQFGSETSGAAANPSPPPSSGQPTSPVPALPTPTAEQPDGE